MVHQDRPRQKEPFIVAPTILDNNRKSYKLGRHFDVIGHVTTRDPFVLDFDAIGHVTLYTVLCHLEHVSSYDVTGNFLTPFLTLDF